MNIFLELYGYTKNILGMDTNIDTWKLTFTPTI